jgi:hypothetical protein
MISCNHAGKASSVWTKTPTTGWRRSRTISGDERGQTDRFVIRRSAVEYPQGLQPGRRNCRRCREPLVQIDAHHHEAVTLKRPMRAGLIISFLEPLFRLKPRRFSSRLPAACPCRGAAVDSGHAIEESQEIAYRGNFAGSAHRELRTGATDDVGKSQRRWCPTRQMGRAVQRASAILTGLLER